jgi:hypothetical protein
VETGWGANSVHQKNVLQDLYWRTLPYYFYRVYKAYRRGEPVPVPHKLKIKTIEDLARKNRVSTFIETGTYRGDTVAATQHLFKCIHTIELSSDLANAARNRFKEVRKVSVHEGDSGTLLPQVIAAINEPCLFWLDAHYSAGITAQGALDSPIVQELRTIFAHATKGHVILIDDAREFTGHGGYPTMEELHEFVLAEKPGWRLLAYNDIIRIWDPAVSKG